MMISSSSSSSGTSVSTEPLKPDGAVAFCSIFGGHESRVPTGSAEPAGVVAAQDSTGATSSCHCPSDPTCRADTGVGSHQPQVSFPLPDAEEVMRRVHAERISRYNSARLSRQRIFSDAVNRLYDVLFKVPPVPARVVDHYVDVVQTPEYLVIMFGHYFSHTPNSRKRAALVIVNVLTFIMPPGLKDYLSHHFEWLLSPTTRPDFLQ